MDNDKEVELTSNSEVDLANEFSKFFSEEVKKIRESIKTTENSDAKCDPATIHEGVTPLSEFTPATEDEMKQIVFLFGVKCSPEDSIPALLLKDNLETFIPYWLEIVTFSLEVGSMDSLKSAIIFPLIKELGSLVDKEKYKNY